jgi:hypothetical protein
MQSRARGSMVAVAELVPALVAIFMGFLVLAFVAALATPATLVVTAFAASAPVTTFLDFFTGAFVGDTETLPVDTRGSWRRWRRFDFWRRRRRRRRRFDFFTGAFVGDTGAFALNTWRAVLVETGAGSRTPRAAGAGKRQRTAGTQHQKTGCKQRRYP